MFKRRQITQWLMAAGATALTPGCGSPPDQPGGEGEGLGDQSTSQAVLTLTKFDVMPGRVRDIGVGAGGHVWAIGDDVEPGGFGIHRWVGSGWHKVPGGAVKIAVDPQGEAWVVNDRGQIFSPHGDPWKLLPGLAMDIGIGANGDVWVIGRDIRPGGFGIHRWDGRQWNDVDGGGVHIAVDSRGRPWVINIHDVLFRRLQNGTWEKVRESAFDIGIGADDAPWVASLDGLIDGGPAIMHWFGKVRPDGGLDPALGHWSLAAGNPAVRISSGGGQAVWGVSPGLRPLRHFRVR